MNEKKNTLDELKQTQIVVAGLGASGVAVSRLLKTKGFNVFAIDTGSSDALNAIVSQLSNEGIEVCIEQDSYKKIPLDSIVVLSPGIKPSSSLYQYLQQHSIPCLSEIDIAYLFCKAPIIAVTGSNGKSTVCSLIASIINASGKKVWLRGNIGTPFSSDVLEIGEKDYVVCEVSSFQLSNSVFFHPYCAVVLNVSMNHLDWHPTYDDYINSKALLLSLLGKSDYAVLNWDDDVVKSFSNLTKAQTFFFSEKEKIKGSYIENDAIIINKEIEEKVLDTEIIPLCGAHNVLNVAVAALVASFFQIDSSSVKKAVASFKSLSHRYELIKTIGEMRFINDSKSTTVGATKAALESSAEKVVLIAGGKDKGGDFSSLKSLVAEKVSKIVVIGEASDLLMKTFQEILPVAKASSMQEAVEIAYNDGKDNYDVLLSPMCASFDMFDSFKHRGEVFKKVVEELET